MDPRFERLHDWLAEVLRIDPAIITPETKVRDLAPDSLDRVELALAFEEGFPFEQGDWPSDVDWAEMTIGEWAAYLSVENG